MSSKGTAEERQFLIEVIEKNIGHSLRYGVWQVLSTYSNMNKKNEQNAKLQLLNKYKKKYLNVEKKYVINE